MFTIDRGNGTLLGLLDLSTAFDTIDHQILFHILEHSSCITDSALALMKSYLDGRQHCVQIDEVITEFSELACRVPQRSVLGPMYLYATDRFNNLEVIFDKCIKLDYHISSVCKSTYFNLRNIGSIRSILSNDACAQLIHSLVTVRLDYCNSILHGLPNNSLYRLHKIQNTAARI